jgi:hypothetical protein
MKRIAILTILVLLMGIALPACGGGEEGTLPLDGWCCFDGEVFPSSEPECVERGGHFFTTQEEADDYCQGEMPSEGWCCLDNEVFPSSEPECVEREGRFFTTQGEAEDYCQTGIEQPTIRELKGPDWRKYVGTTVTIEGIFVRDPLPMLITDLGIVKVNMPMPEDGYIILIGNQAEEIDPEEYGGAKLRLTGLVEEIDDSKNYLNEYVAIQVIAHELLERVEVYNPKLMLLAIHPEFRQPNRIAVLFSGGIDQASNHIRYWNDLKFMYSTLVNEYGYMPANIAVLYADGKQAKDPQTGKTDTQMPVHYSATQANLQTVFNLLKQNTTTQDFIFMFTTNHGGGFCKAGCQGAWGTVYYDCGGQVDTNGDEPSTDILWETDYNMDLNNNGQIGGSVSWDEELCSWGGSIFDDTFANMFANLKYDRMVIVMEQCFSGGLISDMAGSNRIIISAAGEYQPSYAMGPYPYDTYNEFSYYFTCAINGADEKGKAVNADANNDGVVSMVEAFNYARTHDTAAETPHYEDSGDGVPHSGSMPAGGDGTLGSNTSLD